MKNNKILIMNIDKLLSKLNWTSFIKERFKKLLIQYEYCRNNKILHYPVDLENIDLKRYYLSFIGFMDGDGSIKSGKRVGHIKGIYRFAPNFTLKIHQVDTPFLELIIRVLDLSNKSIYISTDKNGAYITISKQKDIKLVMDIIDNNQVFLTQKKARDYLLFKKLLLYIDETQLITHDIIWVEKGLEIIKDLNTYNNLPSDEKTLNNIKKNLSIDYILGFIEAEGSLILHYNTKKENIFNSFEITQNKANNFILLGILDFIKEYNNPLIIKENVEIKSKGIVEDKSKSRKQTLSRLTLTNNDVLFNKIIPLMMSSNLYSKMQINLIYWIFGVIICKDLKSYDECKNLYLKIKEVINSNSTDLLDLNEILIILNKYL